MNSETQVPGAPRSDVASTEPDRQLTVLASILENLDEVAKADVSPRVKLDVPHQNRLVMVRLGVATGLFAALRARHSPTAAHCLRMALTCSSWSYLLDLSDQNRDELEVAALLHDVGKIGVPDQVLLKPGKFTAEESLVMNRHRDFTREILAACCASPAIVENVIYSPAWYDGRSRDFDRHGEDLPRGARILAIVDAFDSMTTDHVYRRAFSRERAMTELFEHAGTQFDPDLVRQFGGFLGGNCERLRNAVLSHWLQDLAERESNGFWQLHPFQASGTHPQVQWLFHEQLLDTMHASVVFVDHALRILKWSRDCEVLTGLKADALEQRRWDPALLQLRDEHYKLILADRCPVIQAIRSGEAQQRQLVVSNTRGDKVLVDAQISPVVGRDGAVCGVTLLMLDASSRLRLEEKVQALNEQATQDGLTKVANRVQFDRVHDELVRRHHERGTSYAVIMCDLDHFKKVNDTFGHQAGDKALVTFAALLKKYCRHGDLVARYGGEEFVMLCSDCDNATATQRAEAIRRAWAARPHPTLDGGSLTASFGVTELQAGDTAETVLRRADRALLQAKDNGRNLVVQLGSGMSADRPAVERSRSWFGWLQQKPAGQILERTLVSSVPLKLAAEKLRGFVADHAAEILEVRDNRIALQVDGAELNPARRTNDRPTPFLIDMEFADLPWPEKVQSQRDTRTRVRIVIRPKRQRDRRQDATEERARQLLMSVKAYLMAEDWRENS